MTRWIGMAVLVAASQGLTAFGVTVETFTDRAAFEARLGTVSVVDFDDIDTSASDPVAFDADRYAASTGMVITGEGGQYVSRSFTFPSDFTPTSPPNLYAPGPVGEDGANDTDVTFVSGGAPTLVAGFGAVFVDADFPGIQESGIAIFDAANQELAARTIDGGDGSQLFLGLVTVDEESGQPVAAIRRAHVVSGSEWPARDVGEGVALDDFVSGGAATVVLPATPLAGKKLLLKEQLVKTLAKDPAVSLGAGNGSVDDPTLHGGSLRVVSPGFDATFDLPASAWKTLGKPGKNKGYKLKKADPVKSVVVKAGKLIKVVAKGAGVAPPLATSPEPASVVIEFGTQRYCATFGGTVKFKDGKKFTAKKAPAPGECPGPASPSGAFLDH
jgi:hypothetical protein